VAAAISAVAFRRRTSAKKNRSTARSGLQLTAVPSGRLLTRIDTTFLLRGFFFFACLFTSLEFKLLQQVQYSIVSTGATVQRRARELYLGDAGADSTVLTVHVQPVQVAMYAEYACRSRAFLLTSASDTWQTSAREGQTGQTGVRAGAICGRQTTFR
jgi:hypothetical protein